MTSDAAITQAAGLAGGSLEAVCRSPAALPQGSTEAPVWVAYKSFQKSGGPDCNLLRPLIKILFFIGSLWLYYNKSKKNSQGDDS